MGRIRVELLIQPTTEQVVCPSSLSVRGQKAFGQSSRVKEPLQCCHHGELHFLLVVERRVVYLASCKMLNSKCGIALQGLMLW